jgi:acetolactate synthase-1/2/3 large subunit
MGFGLPAAIGAKVGAPEKIVVDIDGDASFSMTAMELATASQYNIGVKVLLMNNEFQGMVEQWQGEFSDRAMASMLIADLFYENRYSHTRMTNPDFIKLSESMGAKALRCTNLAELPAMMKEFLEYDGTRPILMECLVSSEHVYPMVAAGKALHEQIVSSAT